MPGEGSWNEWMATIRAEVRFRDWLVTLHNFPFLYIDTYFHEIPIYLRATWEFLLNVLKFRVGWRRVGEEVRGVIMKQKLNKEDERGLLYACSREESRHLRHIHILPPLRELLYATLSKISNPWPYPFLCLIARCPFYEPHLTSPGPHRHLTQILSPSLGPSHQSIHSHSLIHHVNSLQS